MSSGTRTAWRVTVTWLSEALLGIVAALAADAPEVTAAVAAIAGHQQRLGAGVVIGSNVFNLAALLGLGAVVAGRVRLHRKVVVLGGTVAMIVAAVCLMVVAGVVPPAAGFVLVLVTVALYAVALGAGDRRLARLRLPRSWISWIRSAVTEEESELEEAIRPRRARWQDAAVAAGSFTGSVLVPAHERGWAPIVITTGTAADVLSGVLLAFGRGWSSQTASPADPPPDDRVPAGPRSWQERTSLVPGWPVRKLCFLGLEISAAVAVIDAVLGHRVILIVLLIAGPCCVLLTGRWIPTGLTGAWVISLAVVLGLPDGIWLTRTHLTFLAAVTAVAIISTLAAALIQSLTTPVRPR